MYTIIFGNLSVMHTFCNYYKYNINNKLKLIVVKTTSQCWPLLCKIKLVKILWQNIKIKHSILVFLS